MTGTPVVRETPVDMKTPVDRETLESCAGDMIFPGFAPASQCLTMFWTQCHWLHRRSEIQVEILLTRLVSGFRDKETSATQCLWR